MSRGRSYDFYSPFVTASIVQNPDSATATRFPLWIEGMSPKMQKSLVPRNVDGSVSLSSDTDGLQSLAFVSEITIELQLAYIPRITAVLTPPFREGKAFLNSSLIQWGESTLEVQFGYTGGAPEDVVLSPVYSGVLLKPEVTIGQDISITLNAQGIGAFTGMRQDSSKTYQNMTRRAIIREIANDISLDANFDDVDAAIVSGTTTTELVSVLKDVEGFKLVKDFKDTRKPAIAAIDNTVTVSAGGLTQWRMLYQLIREAQCWMYVQGPERPGDRDQLRVIPRNTIMNGVPKYKFTLYDYANGEFGPGDNSFPILSVSSPTSAVYLPSKTRGFLVYGYDSKNRTPQVTQVKNEGFDRTGEGQTQANATNRNPAIDLKKAEGAGIASSDSHQPEFDEQLKAETEAAATNMGVQLNIGTLGIPDILPAEVGSIAGVGDRFDGNYAIFKVTHKIGASGTSTDLELRSNVGQLAAAYDKETIVKDPVNDKKAPTSQEAPGNIKKAKPA